jgi:uncharacterized RDD family membrane protein YckC
MAAEVLTVKGLTGVDMTVRIAGPGTRSYAFLTDWMIRVLLALGWVLVALLLGLLPGIAADAHLSNILMGAGVVLALLTYFLYHPVLELAMKGCTPGKRKAGARIVTVGGATPGAGALVIRNVFRLFDCLPVFYVVGLICCLLTEQRVRLGDLVAGTVLVVEDAEGARSLAQLGEQAQRSTLPLEALQLIHDLLERWPSMAEARRVRLARALLAKVDPGFDPQANTASDERALRARLETLLAGKSGH